MGSPCPCKSADAEIEEPILVVDKTNSPVRQKNPCMGFTESNNGSPLKCSLEAQKVYQLIPLNKLVL